MANLRVLFYFFTSFSILAGVTSAAVLVGFKCLPKRYLAVEAFTKLQFNTDEDESKTS